MKKECKWTIDKWIVYDEYHDFWETECGKGFAVLCCKLKENNINYCPYCGKKIKETKK